MSSDKSDPKVIRMNTRATAAEEVCPICFGTGTRIEPTKGAIICDCRRTNRGTRALDAARIPPRFRKCSIRNYFPVPGNDSQYFAHSFANRLIEEYPAVETGLLFMGSVGVGKTHLAIAILRELIERKGVAGLFYESGSLLKAIQDSYNPVSQSSEMRVLAPVYQAEVLVLDELGATVPTNWVRDTLYQIINTRYNEKRLTIFTTNYLDDPDTKEATKRLESKQKEIQSRGFSDENRDEVKKIDKQLALLRGAENLEIRIGTPLRSRLYEMCKKVEIKGDDYRKRIEQQRGDNA